MERPDSVTRTTGEAFFALVNAPRLYGALLIVGTFLPVFAPDVWVALLYGWGPWPTGGKITGPIGEHVLRWSLSLIPAAIILHNALHLLFVRHRDFPTEQPPEFTTKDSKKGKDFKELKELYFGSASIAIKFGIPLVLTGALCSTMIAALLDPQTFSSWLPGVTGVPAASWGLSLHRATALGFVGAYLYVILLLTQRAFRRDVTTGVALWISAMFVAGPLMSAVFSMIWSAPPGASMGVDVVYLVAGMLPRQFATIAQGFARRLVQPAVPAVAPRANPLSTVRGINPEIEERLAEEGIYDVATLAYADPYLLLRTTSFDRRQIVNWIDEAQLIMVFPDYWQALEKNGFTGAMDVAWTHNRSATLTKLAVELKILPGVLEETAQRLYEDAQIQDLYAIYWNLGQQSTTPPSGGAPAAERAKAAHDPQPLVFRIDAGVSDADEKAIVDSIRTLGGVTNLERVDPEPRMWRVYIRGEVFAAVNEHLTSNPHVKLQQQ